MTPRILCTMLLAMSVIGCGSSPTATDAGMLVGRWELVSVDGCSTGAACSNRSQIVSGSMVFSREGEVVRSLQLEPGYGRSPWVERGTARLVGDNGVELVVRNDQGEGPRTYAGTLARGTLTLTYPHPADGYTVEVYVRRTTF